MDPVTGRSVKKPTSPWVWVGCGCGLAVVLAMALFAGLTYFGFREAKKLEKTMTDPTAREAKVKEVLGYDELPPGYYPLMGFSIPFLLDMAMFTDQEPAAGKVAGAEGDSFKDHGFFFMDLREMRDNREEMRRLLRGEKTKGDSPFNQSNVNFDVREEIGRGTVEVKGTEVLYSAGRGNLKQENDSREGIVAMVMPECPGSKRVRFGLWFSTDPAPDKPVAEADFTGTPADPEALKAFLSHFRLCGG
jgi:hypothetical protein